MFCFAATAPTNYCQCFWKNIEPVGPGENVFWKIIASLNASHGITKVSVCSNRVDCTQVIIQYLRPSDKVLSPITVCSTLCPDFIAVSFFGVNFCR